MSDISELVADLDSTKVVLWDLGPKEPGKLPKPPAPPTAAVGTAEYELAMLDFEPVLEVYKETIRAWRDAKAEHDRWHRMNGGPVELWGIFSCDANDFIHNGRCRECRTCTEWAARQNTGRLGVGEKARCNNSRYRVSASTRGRNGLPNRGLPDGVKPGHGQEALTARILADQEGNARLRNRDPVFGVERGREATNAV